MNKSNSKRKSKRLQKTNAPQPTKIKTIDQIREELTSRREDPVESNVQKLMLINKLSSVDSNIAVKVLNRVKKEKHIVEKKKSKKKKEKATVFTEEDFINFEKEYYAEQ